LPELTRLIERVRKIADGAALMTETAVKAQVGFSMADPEAIYHWRRLDDRIVSGSPAARPVV